MPPYGYLDRHLLEDWPFGGTEGRGRLCPSQPMYLFWRNYLPGCPPPCADWESAFLGACGARVGAGRPPAEGPKRATSAGVGKQ
jgi:hypothetical protein